MRSTRAQGKPWARVLSGPAPCYNRLTMPGTPALSRRIKLLSLALGLAIGSGACVSAWALILSVSAPPVLSVANDTGDNITLTFTHGTESSTQDVAYRIRSNNMALGTVDPAVTIALVSPLGLADLKADVSGYTNRGHSQLATLAETQPGYVPVQASPTALAKKLPGQGAGDSVLDGVLHVTFQAQLVEDNPEAGSESATVIFTVVDGN